MADSDFVIMPYKVVYRRFITQYGIITRSMPANYSQARFTRAFNCANEVVVPLNTSHVLRNQLLYLTGKI